MLLAATATHCLLPCAELLEGSDIVVSLPPKQQIGFQEFQKDSVGHSSRPDPRDCNGSERTVPIWLGGGGGLGGKGVLERANSCFLVAMH